jgi:hypothetical protein
MGQEQQVMPSITNQTSEQQTPTIGNKMSSFADLFKGAWGIYFFNFWKFLFLAFSPLLLIRGLIFGLFLLGGISILTGSGGISSIALIIIFLLFFLLLFCCLCIFQAASIILVANSSLSLYTAITQGKNFFRSNNGKFFNGNF